MEFLGSALLTYMMVTGTSFVIVLAMCIVTAVFRGFCDLIRGNRGIDATRVGYDVCRRFVELEPFEAGTISFDGRDVPVHMVYIRVILHPVAVDFDQGD